jgi:hypothetical protein
MEEVKIYKFQLKAIQNALRLTKQIYVDDKEEETCYARQVKQAKLYAENALNNDIDKHVPYLGNK